MLLSSHHGISGDWHIHFAKQYRGKVCNRMKFIQSWELCSSTLLCSRLW